MIQSFRNYLETRVSFLNDLITALVIVQRKRKRKRKALQQKKEKPVEPIILQKVGIIGVSKTVLNEQYHLIGKSKTLIPDISLYIEPTNVAVEDELVHSICISLTDENTDDIDLSEEEIKLDTVQATGISIEDIETMNQAEKESSMLSSAQKEKARSIAEVLSGTELTLKCDSTFSEKLHLLLENCEQDTFPTSGASTSIDTEEIDNLFN